MHKDSIVGTYDVKGTKFINKIKALQYATANKIKRHEIVWDFSDDYFSKFDWTTEPPESLSYYYTQRCQQLRDTYDYLILYYSGGSDSHNILEHFLKNNIFVDEVVISHTIKYYEKYKKQSRAYNADQIQNEWYYVGKNDLTVLEKRSPNTKITVHDYTHTILNLDGLGQSWIDECGESFQPSVAQYVERLYLPHMMELYDKKKVGHIYGVDKPRVFMHNNAWYLSFLDIVTSLQAPIQPLEHKHDFINIEKFYWAPESANMLIKQAHLIKKFYEDTPNLQFLAKHTSMTYQRRTMIEEIIRSIIYPYWRVDTFQVNKAQSIWMLEFDDIFFKSASNYQKDQWKEGYRYILNTISSEFFETNPNTGIPDAFVGFWSKWYKISI